MARGSSVLAKEPSTASRWRDAVVLSIDEYSMITPADLMDIDKHLRLLGDYRFPFGGFNVVLFGDNCQLLTAASVKPFPPLH